MKKCKAKVPVIVGDYVNVFCPAGHIYFGPDGKELCHGQYYDEWVPNDHGFVRTEDGTWHIFGITHPLTSVKNVHEGEVQLFHAVARSNTFDLIRPGMFSDLGCILPPDERPGESIEIHSPYIVKTGDVYNMIYGPTQFRLAQSRDLTHWELKGELFYDGKGDSRDPQIMIHDGIYYLCYCSGNEVKMRKSSDLYNWSEASVLIRQPKGISPESPFLMEYNDIFYLFICTWDGCWDHKTLSQAYQYKTLVYAGEQLEYLGREPITVIDAHAPEIFESDGQYFISSAERPERGINIGKLMFK